MITYIRILHESWIHFSRAFCVSAIRLYKNWPLLVCVHMKATRETAPPPNESEFYLHLYTNLRRALLLRHLLWHFAFLPLVFLGMMNEVFCVGSTAPPRLCLECLVHFDKVRCLGAQHRTSCVHFYWCSEGGRKREKSLFTERAPVYTGRGITLQGFWPGALHFSHSHLFYFHKRHL